MNKIRLTLLFLGILRVFSAQENSNPCLKIGKVQQRMSELHAKPIEAGEKENSEVLSLFFKELDGSNLFFTTEDLQAVNDILHEKGLCDAYLHSLKLYHNSLKNYDSLVTLFLSKPMQFKAKERFVYNRTGQEHLRAKKADYADYIQRYISYELLNLAYDRFAEDSLLKRAYTADLDTELRKKLLEDENQFVKRSLADENQLDQHILNQFLNAIAQRYDPHSNYFSPDDKSDLEDELSSDVLVFGIQFAENKDFEIEITGITPGSAAWNSNEISEGDILQEIELKKGKKLELKNKGSKYLSQLLSEFKEDEATFYLRSKSGVVNKVKLIKTKIENNENSFTGYVLSDSTLKVGYIALPSFYTDFESDFQLGCANDVAKEILLLKKDQIKALVLDLRGNGGGSLKEAIELSGLFIDEGPMAVYQYQQEKPYLLKDMNRGTVYDGPLIVLINSTSASASEFFAGCMQDYGRALIVGDRSYGKGTAQSVYPLDAMDAAGKQGFLKVTNGRFYHVSGRSNQELGIVPDVLMEDLYSEIDYYLESNQLFHLQNDSTAKKVIYTPIKKVFTPEIIQQSKERIARSKDLQTMKKRAELLAKKVQNDEIIPLDFASFLSYSDADKLFWEEIYNDTALIQLLQISNHSFANKMLAFNAYEKKFNDELIDKLKKDAILYESFLIFKDLFIFDK